MKNVLTAGLVAGLTISLSGLLMVPVVGTQMAGQLGARLYNER